MDRSLPGSAIHGIFQARVLEWGTIAFSPPSSKAKDLPPTVLDLGPTGWDKWHKPGSSACLLCDLRPVINFSEPQILKCKLWVIRLHSAIEN